MIMGRLGQFAVMGGVAVIVLAACGSAAESPPATSYPTPAPVTFIPPTPLPTLSPTPDPLLDRPVPDATLTTLDGDPIRLGALGGEIVFLNFWATWCEPCKEELPELQALHEARGADRVRVIAVTDPDEGQTEADVRAFVDEYNLSLTVALSSDAVLYRRFGVAQIPLTIIIDRAGIVRFRHLGALHDHDVALYLDRLD
jgi:cytochrome c biogenesis protein CcmG/thiol:disulfide interchange protein DsbE